MINTTIYFGGNMIYREPYLRIIDLLFKWKNDIIINKIHCISSGCIYGIFLCNDLVNHNGNYLINHDIINKCQKIVNETTTIINNTTLNNSVITILKYCIENTSDDIHIKCSNVLNIYYTIINVNGISAQISKNKWASKMDLINDIYRSMSIPFISIDKIIIIYILQRKIH